MVDRENREDWRRERSLLALGQAMRGEENASPVSIGDRADPSWREDAATRHQLARSRREARLSPLLAADTTQFEADSVSAAETQRDADEAAGGGYTQTWQPEEPAITGASEARRPTAASELRDTDEEQRPSRNEAVRGGYTQAWQPEAPATTGVAEARRPSAASEPRFASKKQQPSRDDTDAQEWKPLIDPMQVMRGIAGSKMLIVATTVLGTALGIAIAVTTPKKYEATTQLVIEPGDLKLTDSDLTQPVGQPDAALAVVETRIKMLTSGKVLDKVVKDLNLVDDPEFNGQGSGGLGVMSLIRSILSRQDGPGGADEIRRRALAVGNLAKSLSVERSGKTFVVSVSATTQSGDKSANIANKTTTVFQQEAAQYQFDMAGRATNELTSKLDELRKGVEAAERKVEDFRATHDLVDAQGHLISDDQMLKLNEQLSIARARTLELNARAASARSLDVNSVLNGILPEEINSNAMNDLRSQYATLKQEADRAAVRLGPRHPEFQALNAQLDGARERIAAELRRIASSLQVDLKRAVQLEQDLASRLAQAKVQSGDVNSNLVSLRELERDATAKRSVYEQYLLRAKETGEQQNINTTNINVITPAQPPLDPNGPSRAVIALAGLMLGLAAGIGLGAMRGAYESLRETANSRVRRKADERLTRFEDKAYQAAPPSVPPVEAAGTRRSGPIGALLSAVRKIVPGQTESGEKAAGEKSARSTDPISSAIAESEKPMEEPQYPVHPSPHHPPQTASAAHPSQQGAYAPYPQQPPHQMMPQQQAVHPAPPMQPYPAYGQPPMGYPWQTQPPPAGYYPYPPHAGQVPYPPQPAPLDYPGAPLEQGRHASDADDRQSSVDEIRASLREFREAVRELTESRSRRRYF